ncbi:MAG: DUF4403 family protein, partial [Bacteroidota bacterium]|nr:DUF4403 family protein [Bacteroidota bacterium]
SYLDVILGGKPPVSVNTILPRLVTDNSLPDNFEIGVVSDISYQKATQLLKESMTGETYTFEDGKYAITVNDIELYGSGDKLHIRMNVDGQPRKGKLVQGTVYLSGIPYYDSVTSSVRMRDMQYDVKSKNVLVKAASWMLDVGFDRKVQEFSYFPLGEYLSDAKKMLQDGLNENGRISENVFMRGTVTHVQPEGLYLTPTGVKVVVLAKGSILIDVDKL